MSQNKQHIPRTIRRIYDKFNKEVKTIYSNDVTQLCVDLSTLENVSEEDPTTIELVHGAVNKLKSKIYRVTHKYHKIFDKQERESQVNHYVENFANTAFKVIERLSGQKLTDEYLEEIANRDLRAFKDMLKFHNIKTRANTAKGLVKVFKNNVPERDQPILIKKLEEYVNNHESNTQSN